MPGGFPISPRWALPSTIGAQTAASVGTTITANSAANTYGAWTQLTASSPTDGNWILVTISSASLANATFAIDIGLGASGSEVPVINALMYSAASSASGQVQYLLPFSVPAGQRISARAQCNSSGSATICVMAHQFTGGFADLTAPGPIDTVGWENGVTLGQTIDPGASANTKGAYTQIVASTTNDYQGFVVGFDYQLQTNSALANWLVDIALGGSGSENVILSNFPLAKFSVPTVIPGTTPILWMPIPAGQRISARAASTSISTTARKIGITLYGIR